MKQQQIQVDRVKSNEDATLSILYIDNELECNVLEDEYREEKIHGETRIKQGTYKVQPRTWGGFHNRYKRRFKWHKGMLWMPDVPDFEYILFHIGNYEFNTDGCLLTGYWDGNDEYLQVNNSTNAYKRFYNRVIEACLAGKLTCKITDLDR